MRTLLRLLFCILLCATPALAQSVVLGVAPNFGSTGQSLQVIIKGISFPVSLAASDVRFGSDIAVTSLSRLPQDTVSVEGEPVTVDVLRVGIQIPASAAPGQRAVRVGTALSFTAAVFNVVSASAPPPTGVSFPFGTPLTFPANVGPNGISGGDFTRDGVLDLAVGAPGSNSLILYRGLATGRFVRVRTIRNDRFEPSLTAVADLNGDGRPDIVTASENLPGIGIWIGVGKFLFRKPVQIQLAASCWGIGAGDFNGDGRIDVACAARDINSAILIPGRGDGTFDPARMLAARDTPKSLAVGDLNQDGLADVVVGNYSGGISIYLGNRATGLSPQRRRPAPVPIEKLIIADLNGDALPDVATVGDDSILIYRGKGNGDFFAPRRIRVADFVWNLAAGDFNLDGKTDLAYVNIAAGQLSILTARGNLQFGRPVTLPTRKGPADLLMGDFNGDSKPDLAVTCSGAPGSLQVFLNQIP